MSLSVLGTFLESSPEFQKIRGVLGQEHANVRVQVSTDAAAFALSTLWQGMGTPMLVIAPRPEDARRLHEQLSIWSAEAGVALHFPETETQPFERLVSDIYTTHERLRTLSTLTDRSRPPPLVVASTVAISQKTIGRGNFESSTHSLRRGQRLDLEETLDLWRRIGYRVEPSVEGPGQVSRRGGILDTFPLNSGSPARVELWGNEIESIRLFDPVTQRSTSPVDSVTIIPAQETLPGLVDRDDLERQLTSIDVSNCAATTRERLSEEFDLLLDGHEIEDLNFYAGFFNHGSLLDYFPEGGLLVMYRPTDISDAVRDMEGRSMELRAVKERRGELPSSFPSSYFPWQEADAAMSMFGRRLDVTPWGIEASTRNDVIALPFNTPPGYFGKLASFAEEADKLAREGHCVVAITSVPKRVGEVLEDYGVKADLPGALDEPPPWGSITVLQTSGAGLNEGYVLSLNDRRLVVFSDAEIFGVAKQHRSVRHSAARRASLVSELSPGDYMVHVEHGIGRFVGTGSNPRDQGGREYLILQYAQGDKLYVPMDHLDRVSPFTAPRDQAPRLTRLGTQEWRRTKERVERSTREMAAELLSLYAVRELAEGHAAAADTPWQVEMEDSFPYEETHDQRAAIGDVKSDMEHSSPMDRIVCGDVGYGKTEIAVRAAFKAVMDGKQVAMLVPTTVLAQQHYVTFSQRLGAYPVAIEVLSRFRSDHEQRHIVEGLADSKIDICIGTHRLIQKDVRFKDLGLVIIDEEQRFGVAHKERLKQMRHEVDVLTLTATPIPRTLHLSLAGIRDMSTIDTPPEERLPIKTYVSEFSDDLIREAIRREMDRQGQVFFLHNRVYNIDYMAGYIRMLVPEAMVGIAHGQMPEDQLERSMIDFAAGKMDVMVCTTIIESGLDMPNVNTLIVNRADTFGLAQLYQLRGRVGRGVRRAYSYLLIPPSKSITETAEKRLKTMLAATELGAGFRIAMKDMEIRGAGNVLGAEQSGHIHAVGFDLYTRLLSSAVEAIRAQRETGVSGPVASYSQVPDGDELVAATSSNAPPSLNLGIPSNIPQDYISDLSIRLSIYRRLVSIATFSNVDSMEEELVDRFGPLPWEVQNLLYMVRLKIHARQAGIESVTREGEKIVLQLKDDTGGARHALQTLVGRDIVVGHSQVRLDLGRLTDGWEGPLVATVEKITEFRERLAAQLDVGVGLQAEPLG